jgi:hydroxyacyl-ACP dehydratase HTD2-like protein with hotdog domain
MTLEGLAGRAYGPAGFVASPAAVADFGAATGDDRGRWEHHAQPGFAAAALFAVAPAFLADPEVAPHCRSLLHAEQSFSWGRALRVGEEVMVRGTVRRVRARGPLHLVTFEVAAGDPDDLWFVGLADFVLSAEAAGESAEEEEPPFERRAACDPALPGRLPAPGEALPSLRRSASRADLARYAAATGDANPIHLDHAAARAAGLPGVVAHGLLLAAWFFQAAARFRPGPHPLESARVRFRRPLRPAVAAAVAGRRRWSDPEFGPAPELEMAIRQEGLEAPVATAGVRVTP